MFIGLVGQVGQRVPVGAGAGEFEVLEKAKLTEEEYLRWIIKRGYTNWIETASKKSRLKSIVVEFGNILTITGIGLLLARILFTP